jgi:replication initiation protein RepC
MTVAKIHDLPIQGAVAIGRLIPKLDRFYDGGLPEMPSCLATRPERERYCAEIKSLMGRRAYPRSLADRISRGRSVRLRVLKVLDRLSLRGCGSLPVSRTQWLRLKQLSLFCSRDQDWACPSGPMIGATTAKLADYLGVNDVNEAMAPLLKLGLRSPCANGRRSFHVARANCDDETVYGSGWTLAPLILHLNAFEDSVEVEQRRLADRQSLVVQTRSMLRSIQQDLVAGGFECDDIDAHRILSARFHNARKGRLSRLQECHAEALAMIETMGDQFEPFADNGEEDPCTGVPDSLPALYKEKPIRQICTAFQDGMGGKAGNEIERRKPGRGNEPDLTYGLDDVNYHPSEAQELFPETDGLVPTENARPAETIATLAAISGISGALARRVESNLGALPTSVCLLIIAQKLAKGQLLATPDRYLAGMLKRARSGDLNLGKSIKSLRKNVRQAAVSLNQDNAHATH